MEPEKIPLREKSTFEIQIYNEKNRKRKARFDIGWKGTHLYEPVKSVPSLYLVLLLSFYMTFGYIAQLVEDDMISVLLNAEISNDDTSTFSEEVARQYLNRIVGDQPRVCGTVYHLNKTRDMKSMVDEVASTATIPVYTDWQLHSANFWMDQSSGHAVYYQNVSNVIALLEGRSGFNGNVTGSSILVNCHYDSVPYALGASDDAAFCAVMMETLSRLSRKQDRFQHNVIFLFNGAEENGLQGSHAFLRHNWAAGVTTVVNLDAAGMNGKPTLFQVTDSRVLKIYERVVKRPQAQAFGELLFSTGLIPSDTDKRIWRAHGNIQGVDIAFTKWGHVYHTRYDVPELIKPGVLQTAGEMLLNLIVELADDEQFDEMTEPSTWVYYDYLNMFMVCYSSFAANVVDTLIIITTFFSIIYYIWLAGFRESMLQDFLYCTLGRLLAETSGIIVIAIFMPLMVVTTVQMRYLMNPWIVVPIFWIPFLIGGIAVSQTFDAWRYKKTGLNRSMRVVQSMTVTRIYMAVVLLCLLWITDTASIRYVIAVPLFIMSICSSISITVIRIYKLEGWQHLLLEVTLSLPSTMWLFSIALRLNSLLQPIMGRSGVDNPDYIVGIVNVFLVILVCCPVAGLELFFSRKHLWMVISGLLSISVIIMFIPFSVYGDDGISVQRHYWFHTEIQSFNFEGQSIERTSGVLVTKHDPYTIISMKQVLQERNINVNIRTDFTEDCAAKVYCNLPIYRPRFGSTLGQSLFLYMDPPAPFDPRPSLTASKECYGEVCVFSFEMIGANHNMLTLWPQPDTNVTSWSLSAPLQETLHQLSRPVYVLVHTVATYNDVLEPLRFNVTMLVPLSMQSSSVLSVSHQAHRLHHPQYYTTEYSNLIEMMPKYFNIDGTMTIRSNYEF